MYNRPTHTWGYQDAPLGRVGYAITWYYWTCQKKLAGDKRSSLFYRCLSEKEKGFKTLTPGCCWSPLAAKGYHTYNGIMVYIYVCVCVYVCVCMWVCACVCAYMCVGGMCVCGGITESIHGPVWAILCSPDLPTEGLFGVIFRRGQGPGPNVIKNFVRNLQIFIISLSVCTRQALPA